MEEQMRKERAEATRTSKHQLQSIMSELRALKDKHEKDTKARKVEEKTLLQNIKASIDPVLKLDYKTSDQIGVGARLKHLQEEVTNYLPPTVNKKRGAAVTTDDTFGDLTLGGYRDAKHVHFASTPIRPEISNINLTPPRTHKEETISESVLYNTMQTLASEFKLKFKNSEVAPLPALYWYLNPGCRTSSVLQRIETLTMKNCYNSLRSSVKVARVIT